jgi:hypothetical protein
MTALPLQHFAAAGVQVVRAGISLDPATIGTIPAWSLVGLMVVAIVKMRPLMARIKLERDLSAVGHWERIEDRVSKKLEECEKRSERDARTIKRLDDENFRLKIVTTLLLEALERIDPGSDIIKRAQAVMVAVTSASEMEGEE